jgi:uncharacterized membrane protein YdbT with pleckstrin-like domain
MEYPVVIKPAWRAYLKHFLFSILSFMGAIYILAYYPLTQDVLLLSLFCVGLGIFGGVLAVLNRYSNRLEIWKNRIVLVKGIIARDEVEISIPNIRTFRIEQSICQRLLRIGNIYIASAGTTDYEEKIFGVSDPKKVKQVIFENLK